MSDLYLDFDTIKNNYEKEYTKILENETKLERKLNNIISKEYEGTNFEPEIKRNNREIDL